MHIRHLPLYAVAAGALVVSVLLFGDGDGADAATDAVTGTVRDTVTGAASAAGRAHEVAVEPATVAPGTAFSVDAGAHCAGRPAEARFGGAGIPALQLSSLSDRTSGSAVVPQGTAPGTYTVTVTCGGAGSRADRAGYDGPGGRSAGHGGADQGRQTFTGTMVVSGGTDGSVPLGGMDEGSGSSPGGADEALAQQGTDESVPQGGYDEVAPQGGAHTGLGGAAGSGPGATALGAALLLGAAGWGAFAHRRRARGPRGPQR
ncbi:hypothetical protein [Streptomyces lydicus]|uniref:hypothetical protein n=1 Tax=Streptomyces lydicus TaxID=47763 RepID=UPI0037ACB38F